MKTSVKCNKKAPAPRPSQKAPARPHENPLPWWQDDSYNNATTAVVEDPDRYKSNFVNDPPLRRNCY
jgi:hypothetical protein